MALEEGAFAQVAQAGTKYHIMSGAKSAIDGLVSNAAMPCICS